MSDIRNLGVFATVNALWAAHPEGGQEGDYAYIGASQAAGTKYRWNKYDRIWENGDMVTQSAGRRNQVNEGDFTVNGKTTLGGNARIAGNLRVEGTVDAKQIKSPDRGLFPTVAALEAAYPDPEPGWWAIVGSTVPGPLYHVVNGEWAAILDNNHQPVEGGVGDVDLTDYFDPLAERVSTLEGAVETIPSLADNLETNDATKALTAKQGVVLKESIDATSRKTDQMYPNVVEETSVDPTEQELYSYQINTSNKYTTDNSYKHIRVAVVPGQKVLVKASSSNSCQMAWLRNNNAPSSGGTPALVSGTERFDLPANTQDIFIVPEGAKYLYIYASKSPYAFLPSIVSITASKVHGVVDSLDSDSSFDALAARHGKTLEHGYADVAQDVTRNTGRMISNSSYINSNGSSTYVVYSIPVLKGDFVRLTASDDDAHTLRYGFATSVEESAAVWSLVDQTVDSVDVLLEAPFDGYFVVYHLSSYFSDMLIAKRVMTTDGAVSHGTKTLLDGLAFMLGVSDYEKVIPFWLIGKFQYYNSNSTANSASMARTGKIPVNGRKWIYFTQYMSTGTGSSGIRFFNAEDGGIIGYRIVINSPAAGLRRVLIEVPDGASYFIATCSQSQMVNWFAYLFDDDKLAELIRVAENKKHIKVCLLGNSYTADGWRYVPTMLLQYGITMESFFYYRGSGSLYDLDTQWTDTGSTGISDLDGGQHSRITFYVNSENDPVWREWGTVLSAADIVGRRKWDIITLQQGGNRCKDIESYSPSLQNIIDKIAAICDYPYALWWYMAYNGSSQNAIEGANQESLDTQKTIIKSYPFSDFIPAAAAVFNAQQNETLAVLGGSQYNHMYASDNVHMQEGLPCYVVACAIVQKLLNVFRPGLSVLQDKFRAVSESIDDLGMTQTANGGSTGVNDENCYLAQKAAIVANNSPFEIIPV